MTLSILLLVCAGLCSVIVGVAVGHVERRGYSLVRYQLLNCAVCVAVAVAGWAVAPSAMFPSSGCPPATWALVLAGTLLCGVFQYLMILMMGRAMKRGPNAIVWAIIQSGFIYPFLMGWLVFGEPMSAGRAAGILMIVASIFLYAARGKANGQERTSSAAERAPIRAWLVPALLGMLFCGLNQCGGSLPSHLPRGDEFPSIFRDLMTSLGELAGCTAGLVRLGLRGDLPRKPTRREFAELAGFAIGVLCINYTASVMLLYPGLDLLKAQGRVAMGFPIMVASCIAAFFPYGLIVLREKLNPVQALGAAIGIAGIILGCL